MHPSDTDLEAYLAGSLPPTQASDLELHFSVCPECTGKADRTRAPVPSDTPSVPHEPAGEVPAGLRGNPKYQPVCLLGEGGMGSVWLAEHAVMGRRVAIKLIRPEYLARPGALDRFRREARAVAKLQHANVVTAYDADEADGVHFLVMEYVPGENLGDVLKEAGPFPIADAVRAGRDVALGLAAAHAVGLIHRDIKPGNLIRTAAGRTKILDFGLASAGADGGDLTGANVVMGTPHYIAPEQAVDARTADARADLYSLGCTLYALLSGSVPFPVAGTLKKLDAHRHETPRPLRALRPEVPEALAAVVARLMAKRPEDRYQSATEAAEALEGCRKMKAEPEADAEVLQPDSEAPSRWLRLLVVIPAVLVVVMAVGAVAAIWGLRDTVKEGMAEIRDLPPTPATQPPVAPVAVPPSSTPTAKPADVPPSPKPPRVPAVLRELYAVTDAGARRVAAAEGGLWLCGGTEATIRRRANGEVVRTLGAKNVAAAAWSADGGLVAVASDDTEKVHVFEAADGTEAVAFDKFLKGGFQALAFAPEAKAVYAGHAGKLHRLDVLSKAKAVLYAGGQLAEMPFAVPSPDGTQLAYPERVLSSKGKVPEIEAQVRVVRISDGKDAGKVAVPGSGTNGIRDLAWAADGRAVYVILETGRVRAYSWPDGKPLFEAVGHAGGVKLALLPGGDLLASAGGDGFLRLWDAATGDAMGEVKAAPDGRLVSLAAAPDTPTLYTADSTGTAKAWAVERAE